MRVLTETDKGLLDNCDVTDATRDALNAALGRPSTGRVDSALRCVATRDLPAGSLVLADGPGAPLSSAAATPPRLVRPATRCVCLLCPSCVRYKTHA